MALFHGAAHSGTADGETHRGTAGTPGCGPYVVLSFRVVEDVVREARFQTYGCPAAIACSEAACTWSEGRPLAALSSMTPDSLNDWVDGVPEGKEHCPALASQALLQIAACGASIS